MGTKLWQPLSSRASIIGNRTNFPQQSLFRLLDLTCSRLVEDDKTAGQKKRDTVLVYRAALESALMVAWGRRTPAVKLIYKKEP